MTSSPNKFNKELHEKEANDKSLVETENLGGEVAHDFWEDFGIIDVADTDVDGTFDGI